jgi:hypothetical protein
MSHATVAEEMVMQFQMRRVPLLLGWLVFGLTGCGTTADDGGGGEVDGEPVEAASSAVSASVCGSGYKLVGVIPMVAEYPRYPAKGGEIEVFYNASAGKNCLITQSLGAWYGVSKHMAVQGCVISSDRRRCVSKVPVDQGNFKYYAGPIYLYAPHQCIEVEGFIDDPAAPIFGQAGSAYVGNADGFCG